MKDKNFIIGIVISVLLVIIIALLVFIFLPSKFENSKEAENNINQTENKVKDDINNSIEKRSFVQSAQKLYQIAQTAFINDAMNNKEFYPCYDGSNNHNLFLSDNTLRYYVEFDMSGNIINFQLSNNSYNINKSGTEIKIEELNDANDGKIDSMKVCID